MDIREYVVYREQEILSLYASVGWTAYTDHPETLKDGFANSLLILGAYEQEKLLGIIRVVGDAATVVFVQDLLVHPAAQRRGIGSALLQAVLERYHHVRQIELVTDDRPETLAFYQKLGFRCVPEYGCCGMMRIHP